MRRPLQKTCAWLLVLLACALPFSAAAADSVRIPASVRRLNIPEMPEPVPLTTYAQNNGKKAYLDGDYSLYFEDTVDFAAVDWVNELEEVETDKNGKAVHPADPLSVFRHVRDPYVDPVSGPVFTHVIPSLSL